MCKTKIPDNYEEVFDASNDFFKAVAADLSDGITYLGIAKEGYGQAEAIIDSVNPNIKAGNDICGEISSVVDKLEETFMSVSADVISYDGLLGALKSVISDIKKELDGQGAFSHEKLEKLLDGDSKAWEEFLKLNSNEDLKFEGNMSPELLKKFIQQKVKGVWVAALAVYFATSDDLDANYTTDSLKSFFKSMVTKSLKKGTDIIGVAAQKQLLERIYQDYTDDIVALWETNHPGTHFEGNRDQAIQEYLESIPEANRQSAIQKVLTGASGEMIKLGLTFGVALAFQTDFFQNWGDSVGETLAVTGAKTVLSWAGGKIGAAIGTAIGGPVGSVVGFGLGIVASFISSSVVNAVVDHFKKDSDGIPYEYKSISYDEAIKNATDATIYLNPNSTEKYQNQNRYEIRANMKAEGIPSIIIDYVEASDYQNTEALYREDGYPTPEALALSQYYNSGWENNKFRNNPNITAEEIEEFIDNMIVPDYYSDEEAEAYKQTIRNVIAWESTHTNNEINDAYALCGDLLNGPGYWNY